MFRSSVSINTVVVDLKIAPLMQFTHMEQKEARPAMPSKTRATFFSIPPIESIPSQKHVFALVGLAPKTF